MSWGESLDLQRSALRWDIKRTMNNLCKKLCDIGEECFVVTVNVSNGVVGHMGSLRGSEFINDKTYIPYSFLEYCRESVDMSPEYSISDTESVSENDDIADDETPIVLSVHKPVKEVHPSHLLPTEKKKEKQRQEVHPKQQPVHTKQQPIHSKQQPVHSEQHQSPTKQQSVHNKPLTFFQRKMLHLNSTPVKEYRKPGRPRKSTTNTTNEADTQAKPPAKKRRFRSYDAQSSNGLYTEHKQRLKLRSNIEQNVIEMYKTLNMPIDSDKPP